MSRRVDVERVEAALRLLGDEHITPIGARVLREVLYAEDRTSFRRAWANWTYAWSGFWLHRLAQRLGRKDLR